jgi:hypothetical protein
MRVSLFFGRFPPLRGHLHCYQIASAQTSIAKSVIGRNSSAKKRGGFHGSKLIRDRSYATCFGDYHFRISSVHGYSGYYWVLAVHEVSAPAWFADSVFTAEKAHTDALTDFPSSHPRTQGLDTPHDLVPGNAWQTESRPAARDRGRVRVTYSTCFHPHSYLARARL